MLVSYDMDHIKIIFSYIYSQPGFAFKLFFFCIRMIIIMSPVYLLATVIIDLLGFVILELFIASEVFFHLNCWINFYFNAKLKHCLKAIRIIGKKTFPNFKLLVSIHAQVKVMEGLANQAYFYFLPSLLLFGGYLLVVTNYATIRMHNVIPMPFFLAMPALSVVVTIIIVVLFPAASDVHEKSCEFLKKFHLIKFHHKYWVRRLKAERSFRFTFGPLFMAKKSTQTTFLVCIFDATINTLLLKRV